MTGSSADLKSKNLKAEYRKVKDNGETGRGRKTCKFYSELDSILGHRPASVPTILLDTGNSTTGSSTDSQHSEPEEKEDNLDGKEIKHYMLMCSRLEDNANRRYV